MSSQLQDSEKELQLCLPHRGLSAKFRLNKSSSVPQSQKSLKCAMSIGGHNQNPNRHQLKFQHMVMADTTHPRIPSVTPSWHTPHTL